MIIVMNNTATEEQIENVVSRIKKKGLEATISKGIEKTLVGAVGDERLLDPELLQALPGVEQALHIVKPYKIVAREWHKEVKDYCDEIGIHFSTSPYDFEAVDLCIDLDLPFIKIGSKISFYFF